MYRFAHLQYLNTRLCYIELAPSNNYSLAPWSHRRLMMQLRFLVPVLLLTSSTVLSAQDRSYGRSVVATPFGIIATSEVEAS
jgi:hypothetical protein